jgi:hypothetical protein
MRLCNSCSEGREKDREGKELYVLHADTVPNMFDTLTALIVYQFHQVGKSLGEEL